MSKSASILGTIFIVFVLYLFMLFALQIIVNPHKDVLIPTARVVQEAQERETVKFKLQSGNDILELRENFGDIYSALTEKNLPVLLQGGQVFTSGATTKYNQYLRFEDADNFDGLIVNFTKDDKISDYIYVDDGNNASDAMFEYEIEFEEGFESDISSNKLSELDDETINVLGRVYTVTNTKIDIDTNEITIQLTSAPIKATMKEGEKKVFKIEEREYEIEVAVVTDVTTPRVSLIVNGVQLKTIQEGELTPMNGHFILVDNILSSEAGEGGSDQVDIYIEVDRVTFSDSDYTDTSFVKGLDINGKIITDGFVQIRGTEISSTEFEITSINYRLVTRDELHIGAGEGLKEKIPQKEAMITPFWDVVYEGLSNPDKTSMKLDPSGDDSYRLHFTNRRGRDYIFPLLNNKGGTFNFGDDDNNLTFIEAANTTNYIVNINDYFVLNNDNDRTGYTNILRYNTIDTASQTLTFDDLATGTKQVTYQTSSTSGQLGTADLVVDGNTYRVYIQDNSGNPLAIDLNGDGSLNSGEANIVLEGGGIIDLGSSNYPGNFTITLTTQSSQLDEASGDETIQWQMESRVGNEVGISSFSGTPLSQEDDHSYGLTTYGVFVDLLDESSSEAETLVIEYPQEQIEAEVYVIVEIPAKEKVSEEAEEIVEETVEEPEVKEETKEEVPIPQPREQPRETVPQVPVRTPAKKVSIVLPLAITIIVILILVVIALMVYNKLKPKEPSIFQSYMVR
ncbi:MAG: hypothetical protein Q8R00_03410 [Candidatus Nanoarchaeia archaeon]|nr:hypothetical protein [Candidatus Nanoarchaeia archaeon]